MYSPKFKPTGSHTIKNIQKIILVYPFRKGGSHRWPGIVPGFQSAWRAGSFRPNILPLEWPDPACFVIFYGWWAKNWDLSGQMIYQLQWQRFRLEDAFSKKGVWSRIFILELVTIGFSLAAQSFAATRMVCRRLDAPHNPFTQHGSIQTMKKGYVQESVHKQLPFLSISWYHLDPDL